MRSKLLTVAEDLVGPIEEAARAEAEDADLLQPAAAGADDAARADDAGEGETPLDPRYEDLWVHKDPSIEIPDLTAIDLDFDERDE